MTFRKRLSVAFEMMFATTFVVTFHQRLSVAFAATFEVTMH
jgi:hypothetical protein